MYLPSGIIPPVPTFITDDLELDHNGMEQAIDHLIAEGVSGLFFLGTGGEFPHMTLQERQGVAEHAVRYVQGRVPVLIGTGTTSTRQTIQLNDHAKAIGADAVVVINPYYYQLGESHLFAHYDEILHATDMPVLLYNFPDITGQDLPPEMIARLLEKHGHLVGMKNTVDSLAHTKAVLDAAASYKSRFHVLAGLDDYVFGSLSLGCTGAITGTANFAPRASVQLYEAFQEEDYTTAQAKQNILSGVSKIYRLDKPFIGMIKEAVRQTGLPVTSQTFPPVKPASDAQKEDISRILEQFNK